MIPHYLPSFLFNESTKFKSKHNAFNSFSPAHALSKDDPFLSLSSPNRQPKKKNIYLNYQSFLLLDKSSNIALIIAKLKQEGFEVFLIFDDCNQSTVASSVNDQLKFSDQNKNIKSVFSIDQSFIRTLNQQKDFTQIAGDLELVVDDSIILDSVQFQQLEKLLTDAVLIDYEIVKDHLVLEFSNKTTSTNIYEQLALDLKKGLEINLSKTNDFNIFPFLQTEESIKKLPYLRHFLPSFNTRTIKNLKEANSLVISEIFRYSIDRAFDLNEEHKNLIVKKVLKFFWFLHPNFKELIANAKRLEEFKLKTSQAIAQELFISEKALLGENSENSALFPIHLIDNLVTSKEKYLEFCERSGFSVDSIDKAILLIFFSAKEYFKNAQNLFYSQTVLGRLIPFISTQQLPTFILKNPPTKENFVIVKTTLSSRAEYEISFDDFVDSFFTKIPSEINLGREFGDAVIDQIFLSDVPKIEVYRFLDLQQQQKFHEKFNQILVQQHQQKITSGDEDKKPESLTKILELIKKSSFRQSKYLPKISLATYQSLGLEQYLSTRDKIILFQHQLDDSRVKIFLQEAIIKEKNKDYDNIEDVTPDMEDLFLMLHDDDQIDLSQYRFNSNFRRITSEFYRQKIKIIAQDQYAKEPIHFGEDSDDFFNLMTETLDGTYSTFPSVYNQKIRRLEDFSDYKLFKPLKVKMNNLDFKDFLVLKKIVDSSAIDISKIVALEIINISGNELIQGRGLDNIEQILLNEVIAFFPNLQNLTINQRFESLARAAVASNPNITIATKIFFEEEIAQIVKKESNRFNSSAQLEITTSKKPQSKRRGDGLFFSRGNRTSIASQLSEIQTFNMNKVGEIIFRPNNCRSNDLGLRGSLLELKLDCTELDQKWLISCQSASLRFLSKLDNMQKFTTLDQVHNYQPSFPRDNNYTICFFQKDLKVESSNILISISPDNKIIGYYVDPSDALLEFSIDDAGFYHVSTNKECTIHYVMQGQELVHHDISENLDNLPIEQGIKEVIKKYVNSDFQLLTTYQSYTLPQYDRENADIGDRNQKWLLSLFDCQNKGSCSHRVMAMSYALRNYQNSFRIIGINNNHVLLEIKGQNDKWYRIDLGGEEADLQYDPASLDESFPKQQIAKSESEILLKAVSKSISSITHSLLTELYQLKTFDGDLNQLDRLLFETTNKSILLKTDHYQSLKNFLLYLEKKYQLKQQSSADTEQSLPIFSNCLVIDKPEHLDCSKKTIVIAQKNEGSSEVISARLVDEQCLAKIEEKTEFSKFLEKALHNPNQKFPLIINYQEFSTKDRVAFNSMFDQVQRAVNGNKIPDNVVIICIDNLRQQITDPAILSRFSKTYDLSRYSKQDIEKFIEEDPIEDHQKTYCIEYDLEGFDDWYQKLFGRIIVDDQKIKWCKSDLVKELESTFHSSQSEQKQTIINLSNISQEKKIEVENLFAQARILGYVEHFGYKIKIPSNLQLKFAREDNLKSQFTFEKVLSAFSTDEEIVEGNLSLRIFEDCLASQNLPNDIHLINSQLFDQLLTIPKIVDGKYHEELGLIAFASTQDPKILKIFVSEQLSEQQFYCLFLQAKKMKVNLEIYLSKDVKILDTEFEKFYSKRNVKSLEEVSFGFDVSPKSQRIIVTNDITQATEKICSNLDSGININLVNVEDVLYQDLFECPNYKIESELTDGNRSLIFRFSKTISQIQEKLSSSSSSQAIILKGKFPKDLLSLLQPQIQDLQKHFTNLYFVIEERVNQTSQVSSQLDWLDSSCYQVQYYQTQQKEKSQIIRENFPEIGAEIPERSKELAQEFIIDRKQKLRQLLQENSLLKIIGHSGVGKSSLIHEIAENGFENKGDIKIYHELDDIEDWVSGDSNGNLKILVVDEFNIDGSLNWTMLRDFADCKLDDQSSKAKLNRQIFYKGKFHQLDEKHRIIFLGNPRNYGNRYHHQLFEERDIKEWHLQDFSVAYIYEKILKEPIYDKIDSKVRNAIGNEEEFKKICIEKIKEYKQKNSKESSDQIDQESNIPEQTVRELQEEVLKIITKKLKEQSAKKLSRLGINRGFGIFDFIRKTFLGSFCFPVNKSDQRQCDELQLQHIQKPVAEISTKDFIATSSNKETLEELSLAIQIRQIQKMGIFPDQKLGTNGVIFEGDSGVGKSVMIEAVLQNQGIKKTEDLQEIEKQFNHISQDQDENNCYYYKIPASLDVSEIKKQLVQAYKLGIIVVFDEINTRIDEDLEKTINALLTGHYVEQGSAQELKPRSGFMIIGSVNSAQNAGRSKISPAIKHRCNIIKAKSLKEYTIDDFVKIISNFLSENKENDQIQQSSSRPSGHSTLFFIKRFSFDKKIYPSSSSQISDSQETIQRIATEFKECANLDPKFNLRALREKLSEIKDSISRGMQITDQGINHL